MFAPTSIVISASTRRSIPIPLAALIRFPNRDISDLKVGDDDGFVDVDVCAAAWTSFLEDGITTTYTSTNATRPSSAPIWIPVSPDPVGPVEGAICTE